MNRALKAAALCGSALSLIAVAGQAQAGGFALREQSAYYQGMSFAGNGTTGPSISSIFWNPATITGAGEGITFESHSSFIIPNADLDATFTKGAIPWIGSGSTKTGDIGSDAWIPASYNAYKVNDDLFVGMSITAPFGLATKPNPNWAGKWYNRSSEVFSVNFNPTVGYKINDMISVGAGIQIQYLQVRLKSAFPLSSTAQTAEVKGSDVGFGVTAGITVKPIEGTEFGLGFRSAVSHKLDGKYIQPAGVALPSGTPFPATVTGITASTMTPEMVTFSVKQRVSDAFRVAGTVEWTNWSRLGTIHTKPKSGNMATPDLKFNYNDGWFFALGGEYDFNEKLTVRAGLAYELSPIDEKIRSARLPDNNRYWLSAGLSYKVMENMSLDLGYTHIIPEKTKINIGPGHQDYNPAVGRLTANADSNVNIFTAAFRYRWGGKL